MLLAVMMWLWLLPEPIDFPEPEKTTVECPQPPCGTPAPAIVPPMRDHKKEDKPKKG